MLELCGKYPEFGLEDLMLPVQCGPAVVETLVDGRLKRGDALHDGGDRALSKLGLHLSNDMGVISNGLVQSGDLALEPFDLICPFAAHQWTARLEVAASRAGGSRSAATEAGFHWIGTGSATMVKWSGLESGMGWLG